MGRTACTEPQCLYKCALYVLPFILLLSKTCTYLYIPNLFESVSTLSTGISKLVIIPCLYDKHVGALFFTVEFVRHVQYSGFGIYLEFSLKKKTVNNGSKSVVLLV